MTLTDADREALLVAFSLDARTRIAEIERALANLRTTGGQSRGTAIEALGLQAHAVRGSAHMVSLPKLAGLAATLDDAVAAWTPESRELDDVIDAAAALRGALQEVVAGADGDQRTTLAEPASTDRAVVLHIEDNLANLKLVERILGHRPEVLLHEARTGTEGLALARTLQPSLVLLDLRLPDMTGEDVLHELHQQPDTRNIPVVAVSAEARPAVADRLLAAGATDFLVKPIDLGNFLAIVDRILARTE
jgi:CheY-like chemotaxis protein